MAITKSQEPLPVQDVPPSEDSPVMSAEAAELLANFKAVDPKRTGVGLDRIRPFYPRMAWSVILTPAKELEALGLLKRKSVMNGKGRVGYELYTWTEA